MKLFSRSRSTSPSPSASAALRGPSSASWVRTGAELKKQVLADETLVGQLVDREGDYALILVRTQLMHEDDTAVVHSAVSDIMQRHEAEGFELSMAGHPAITSGMRLQMMRNFRVMVSLSMALMFSVLWLLFRHPLGVLGPILVVAQSAGWAFGSMALSGSPVTMMTNILPSFLLCVGLGDSIHILAVYRERLRDGDDNGQAIVHAISTTAVPVILTTLTTMAGLLSFRTAVVDILGQMGTAAAFGVFACLLNSLVFLPALLTFNRSGRFGVDRETAGDWLDRAIAWCDSASAPTSGGFARRNRVLIASLGLAGLAAVMAPQVQVFHNPLTWLPPSDPTRVAFDTVDREVGGAGSVQLLISGKQGEGSISSLALLSGMEQLEQHMKDYVEPSTGKPLVGNVTSVNDVVRESWQALNGGGEEAYRLPDSERGVADMLFLAGNAGPEHMRRLVTTNRTRTQMVARVRWLEASAYREFAEHLAQGVEKYVGPHGVARATGTLATLLTTADTLLGDTVRSFGVAFLIITVLMVIMLRDVKLGLIASIPNLLPIALLLAVMGSFDIPLDVMNVMVASIAMGIVVDDTIHFFHHYRARYVATGDVEQALAHAFAHSGRAIVGTSVVLVAGFAVYLSASISSIQRFGGLVALAVALALFCDLLLGPALLRLVHGRARSSAPVEGGEARPQASA